MRAATFILLVLLGGDSVSAWEVEGSMKKLARGAANTATGWLEVPSQVAHTVETEGSLAALSTGLVKGLWNGGRRTLLGAYEIGTFPLANFRRQPIRDPYAPILEPEFITFRPSKS